MCVCVCVRERERDCVCVSEREREREIEREKGREERKEERDTGNVEGERGGGNRGNWRNPTKRYGVPLNFFLQHCTNLHLIRARHKTEELLLIFRRLFMTIFFLH